MSSIVLIVDDDPFIRKLISTTLEDVSGFQLIEAEDGDVALDLAAEQPPSLVFLDIDMPRMNGIETCRRLRELPGAREATIVMLTAAGVEQESEARAAGSDLFLTKPFSPLALLRLVDGLQ
ncbi:MAG TPA: response regulator [Solirubrobacteraceae bacterium]|jgi:two-component system chemotaxis response regulator CheY|nr:response regulator [Solirubrobacteraceae bacterium]